MIASLIEACKLISVEPYAYLANVITRIVDRHPNSRLDELLRGPIPIRPISRPWPENDAYRAFASTSRTSPPDAAQEHWALRGKYKNVPGGA